jgi:hypothetical protein
MLIQPFIIVLMIGEAVGWVASKKKITPYPELSDVKLTLVNGELVLDENSYS